MAFNVTYHDWKHEWLHEWLFVNYSYLVNPVSMANFDRAHETRYLH